MTDPDHVHKISFWVDPEDAKHAEYAEGLVTARCESCGKKVDVRYRIVVPPMPPYVPDIPT